MLVLAGVGYEPYDCGQPHRSTGSRFVWCHHAGTGSAIAVERPIPHDDHERGRRLQSLEGHRGHALARR